MAMKDHPTRPRSWKDVPLPGLHNCLTWQLNATIYPQVGLARFVSILRDPDEQIELGRTGRDTDVREDVWPALTFHLREARGTLLHLAGWPGSLEL